MWSKVLTVSLVVMGLSHTIARERLFAPLRRALGGHDTWLGYLVSCPYCLSHWMAFVLVPVTGIYPIDVVPQCGPLSGLLRWLLSSVLITAIAAFLRVGFYFVDESQGLVRRRQKTAEAETDTIRAAQDVGASEAVGAAQAAAPEQAPLDTRH